jgi:hypothetical protein
MRASIWVLGAIALSVNALPSALRARNNKPWTLEEREYYKSVAEVITLAERSPSFPRGLGQCDMAKAVMPTCEPSFFSMYRNQWVMTSGFTDMINHTATLPAPDAGLVLKEVAIGKGTQNYTCADSTSASTPVLIGALATLYNVSCVAADLPTVLALLPQLALNSQPLPTQIDATGIHYFQGASPYFQINRPNLGSTVDKKLATCTAPSNAPLGQNGKGFGSVPWLKLGQVSGSTALQNTFRLNTAGGAAPATCEGQPSSFQIPYAAEYAFIHFHPSSRTRCANLSYRYWFWGTGI